MSAREIMQTQGKLESIAEEIHRFKGFRTNKNDETLKVKVSTFDVGEDCTNPDLRYYCEIRQEDGKTASGNSADSVDSVLVNVNWYDLDN
jgi:hypothetical protein